MKRKDFFKGIAVGTIGLPLAIRACLGQEGLEEIAAPNVISGKTYEWKMVTTWPPNFPVLGEGCNLFAKWIEEMSGGRMKIKVFGGGELVPALEVFDAVRSGAAEMGSGCAYYWAGKIPAAQFFASVPFGMNAQQVNAWLLNAGGQELWNECYAKYNLVPFAGGNTGVQMGGWFNKEINTIEDFKGLKMRMPGLGGKVLAKAGGSPVLIAGGELYTSLERGVIDATEWIGPYHDYKMGFHQIAKYYYAPGWHEPGTILENIVNKEKFDALPKDLQLIIETASLRLNQWMLSELEAKNTLYLERILAESNAEVRIFSDEILATLRSYTDELIAEMTTNDPFAKKVYDSYDSFRTKARAWSELTEKVFYNSLQNS